MKYKASLRLILATLFALAAMLFLEGKRVQNRRILNKTSRNVTREDNTINVSNTDYIFFQSLSKYFFIVVE